MKKATTKPQNNHWLTEDLKLKVRKLFEPKYNRKLQESEVEEIAENLTGFMETYLKFKSRQKYKTK